MTDNCTPAPAPVGVQVTRERVVAPPERFIALSDEALLAHFEGALGGADLSALFSMLEGVCQHHFARLRRRLEAGFAFFSVAEQGVRLDGGKKGRMQRLSSIEDNERRFLSDFIDAMHASHYRLLGTMEWEAALSEAFLFTLPVTVDWGALDKRMLQRFWGDVPEQRRQLPDLSDRILIFHRGFEPAKMRGRYLMQKVELLISFYLLAPLWAALVKLLQQVGLKAPPPPPMAAAVGHKPDVTFRTVGQAAKAAMKWRRAAQGELDRDESLMHDACTIIERKTMSRHFPTGRSVLENFFERIELQEACFRDVVVLFRRKVGKGEGAAAGEKEIIRDTDTALLARNIHIKQFSGIPLADLEMVMPEKKVFVPPSVFVQLVVAAAVAVLGLLATLFQAQLDWKVWGSALMLLASRASQVYFQASSERNEIEREMNKLLFERTVASQEAVLHTLTDEMCRQHIRECFLCYCCLLYLGKAMRDDDLDTHCERLLRKQFGLRLDFTAEQAIPALCRWGLVQRQPGGRLHAKPLQAALVALDDVWDNLFSFVERGSSGGRGGGTGAGSGSGGGSGGGDAFGADGEAPRACDAYCQRGSIRGGGGGSGGDREAGRVASPGPCAAAKRVVGQQLLHGVERWDPEQPEQQRHQAHPRCEQDAWTAEPAAGPHSDSPMIAASDSGNTPPLDAMVPPSIHEGMEGVTDMPEVAVGTAADTPDALGPASSSSMVGVSADEGQLQDLSEDGTAEESGLLGQPCMDDAQPTDVSVGPVLPISGPDSAAEPANGGAEQEALAGGSGAPEADSDGMVVAYGMSALLSQGPPSCLSVESSSSTSSSDTTSSSGEEYASIMRRPATLSRTAVTRSPSGATRISLQQLRHLESWRRQRMAQEAEGLECLPSSLRLAAAGAGRSRGAAVDGRLAGTQMVAEAAGGGEARQRSTEGGHRSRASQGSPGSRRGVFGGCPGAL